MSRTREVGWSQSKFHISYEQVMDCYTWASRTAQLATFWLLWIFWRIDFIRNFWEGLSIPGIWNFFSRLSLHFGLWPVFSSSWVNRSTKGKNRLGLLTCIMIDIHPTHHSIIIHVGHFTYSPWFTTYLGTHLYQYLAAYWSYVLSSWNCICKNNLRRNWNIFQKCSLYIII